MRWSRKRRISYSSPRTDNAPITAAFKELRKAGYFARQNFWCCQSCAWAAIPEEKADKAVFYHNQDKHQLDNNKETMLAWAGDSKFICEVLEKHGIETKHDGSTAQRINILLK